MMCRAYGVCCGLCDTVETLHCNVSTLRYAQRLYVKRNPVLQLMVCFMVVVGVLDVALQRLYVCHKTLLLQLMVCFMVVIGVLDVAMQRLYRINVTSRSNNRLVLPLHSISNINMYTSIGAGLPPTLPSHLGSSVASKIRCPQRL